MRRAVLLALLVFLGSTASADVQYDIETDRQEVRMNTTVELECSSDCPVSNWRLEWKIPEKTEITSIEDSLGEVESYTRNEDSVLISTNRGEPRNSESVRIGTRIERDAKEIHDGWYRRTLNLSSFDGEKTTGVVETENLISGWIGIGFDSSFNGSEMVFRGEGPTNLRINFGEGEQTDYFEFFGGSIENPDSAYRLAAGTIGHVQNFERFPAAILPDGKYNRTVNSWSSGEYVSGSIRIREGLGRTALPILTHEVVHGLNERLLKWDGTRSTYFDEGTAEYAESLMTKKLYNSGEIDIGPRSLFGEEREYSTTENGDKVIYRVESKGSRQNLWNYYSDNRSFMKTWNPYSSPSLRRFGYAYSELVIKNFVRRGGSLKELYGSMEFESKVDSPEEKWGFYSDQLDMTPCKYEDRQMFERCLDQVNSFDYPVYSASPDSSNRSINITRLNIPERQPETESPGILETIVSFFQGIYNRLF